MNEAQDDLSDTREVLSTTQDRLKEYEEMSLWDFFRKEAAEGLADAQQKAETTSQKVASSASHLWEQHQDVLHQHGDEAAVAAGILAGAAALFGISKVFESSPEDDAKRVATMLRKNKAFLDA